MNILVPNLGSTSLKHQLIEMPSGRVLSSGRVERVSDYAAAVREMDFGGELVDAVAFKAVHAGLDYRGTFVVDDGVIAALERFLPAAPAHNAIYLTGIRAFRQAMPDATLVCAFETEFHRTMPDRAVRYGVPAAWLDEQVRKYGFHGASHQYVSERVPEILGRPAGDLRLVSCHLGGSASVCAIDRGRSIDTTMGFSPQSGIENASRHGDLDVFAVFYMMERHGWPVAEARARLTKNGGLAGLSGVAGGDVRDLEAAAADGNADASLALRVFAYQVRKTIGAYAAAMGGIDAVAFTGGIGENSAALRAECCEGLGFLGIRLDAGANQAGPPDRVVSEVGSPAAAVVLRTNEEAVVARRAYRLLTLGSLN